MAFPWYWLHAATCVPDAGITEFPMDTRYVTEDYHEYEKLLRHEDLEDSEDLDDCTFCFRKKRKVDHDPHTTATHPDPSTSPHAFRSKPRGCKRLIAALRHFACCAKSRRRYQLITRYRYSKQKKPYSAISVHVEQLTSETYDEDDLAGIPELLESIKLQGTGSSEVARAIRKKLKYGNVHRQLRALTILDGILQNGGQRMQRSILSDPPLLERLRIAAVDPISDPDVRTKCKDLFGQWVASSKDNPGLEGAKSLYNQLPKKQKPQQQRREQSRVLRETEEDARREEEAEAARSRSGSLASPAGTPTVGTPTGESSNPTMFRKQSTPITLGSSSTFGTRKVKKDKKSKAKMFNLEREKPNILSSIAASSVASTNLNNALKLVNRERHRVSDDPEVMKRFETCKALRRQILRYIQYVESDEFLGGLIHANEELVTALMAFEVLDKSLEDDSDSELEEAQHLSRQAARSEQSSVRDAEKMVASLSVDAPPKPPRPGPPGKIPMPPRPAANTKSMKARKAASDSDDSDTDLEDDSDDPFGDRNAMKTPDPEMHRRGYGFKEV